MKKKFITPVSMQVTEEQFKRDLKEPLKELDYSISLCSGFKNIPLLINNLAGYSNTAGNIALNKAEEFDRYFIDHYNPELFLALAAMTEGKTFGMGEYGYFENSLFKIKKFGYSYHSRNGQTIENGVCNVWKKVTKEELIKHFTKTEIMEEKKIIGYKLIKPEYNTFYERLTGTQNLDRIADSIGRLDWVDKSVKTMKEAGVLDLWFEPVYEEKEEFKIGEFYTLIKEPKAIVKYTGGETGTGRVVNGRLGNKINIGNISSWRKSTESEILDYLKEEFILRTKINIGSRIEEGISTGIVTGFILLDKNSLNGKNSTLNDDWFKKNPKERYQLGIKQGPSTFSPDCIFVEPFPDIEINGHAAKFFDDYVEFGCAQISKEVFTDLATVNTYKNTNREIESVTIGKGVFSKQQIKEIAEYYLNK